MGKTLDSVKKSLRLGLNFVKWNLTLGREPQTFLDARWIVAFLARLPAKSKRKWALRILNLSPHYFIDGNNPAFRGMPTDEYLETSFELIAASRREFGEKVFKDYLAPRFAVLEYGCGPGFLAKTVAPLVAKVYACDISAGALACAEILNGGENIVYLKADENGLSKIEDESLDAVLSLALLQHLTDETFEIILENCRRKLKKGGRILFHIQLDDEVWKTEDAWRNDKSLKARFQLKYDLHCFGRTLEKHEELIAKYGFIVEEIKSLQFLLNENSPAVHSQFLLVAARA